MSNLEPDICETLISALHNQQHFGKKIYCNGLISLTPEKIPECNPVVTERSSQASTSTASSNCVIQNPDIPIIKETLANVHAPDLTPLTNIGTCADIDNFVKENEEYVRRHSFSDIANFVKENEEFVKRHSLSLRQRTPPRNSVAEEILNSSSIDKAKILLSQVRDMKAKLSEYETCESSDESVILHDEGEFKTVSARKRLLRNKRKKSVSPSKDTMTKKQDTKASPTNNN